MSHQNWIVVGVNGSAGSDAAIKWAAREAVRLDLGLLLAHVYRGYYAMGSFYMAAYPLRPVDDREPARTVFDAAIEEAATILPRDRIDTLALRSDVRTGLLQAAVDARMVVLGDEPHPALRVITGSVIASVASHSPTPVVAVPANWQDAAPQGSVVVGVKAMDSSVELLRHAFQLAAVQQARLVLLHAWEYLARYDDAIAGHAELPDWEQRTRDHLAGLLADVAADFPGVQAEARLVHGQPAQALVEASGEADLLVVTRRPHGLPFGHLGGTGRAVLRESRCPVVVLPPTVELVDLEKSAGGARRVHVEAPAAVMRD